MTPDDQARPLLWLATGVGALGAGLFPALSGGDDQSTLQLLLAVVTFAAFMLATCFRFWLSIAAVSAIGNAAIGLVGTDQVSIPLVATGLFAFAACEGASLARTWRTLDVVRLDVERVHLRAAAQRVALGLLGAAVVSVIGLIDVPSPVVAAAVGVLAAAAVIGAAVARAASSR